MKILMVCLGNVCRSPMAEGILRSKLPNNFLVDSAGVSNYHVNDKPDKRAIEVCKKHNINISQLRGRQFQPSDFDNFDIIYVMDHANYSDILFKARKEADKKKVKLIMSELPQATKQYVSDPFYGDIEDFEKVFIQLDEVCTLIAEKLTGNFTE
ncbi:low molecular weight protein-tyrosine-phosphatase [Apibacter adventoris]|uniref:protein-tyrosine-phosphatase n=1 Tax=Apibacter adventoris TaxID=1679466 RepID=A0A2S8A903_9FLAO|nr:low molecular weight protein-tyrosine-phosphatase [Apibacter adventoris]PQL91048.1 protein-tyrosine-phosphatase [Apibacter adventoris]